MIIAADTRNLDGNPAAELLLKNVMALAHFYPAHRFILFTEQGNSTDLPNISLQVVGPAPKSNLLWKLWYDYKLPGLLKKNSADIFLGPMISNKTAIPQILFAPAVSTSSKKQGKLAQKWMPALLTKAALIFASSAKQNDALISHYQIAAQKIKTVYPTADEYYHSIDWEEREAVKNKWSDGKEYFFVNSSLDQQEEIIHLLKAFSLFKKRQKSNMLLLIATSSAQTHSFVEQLKTYKHRADVKLLFATSNNELAKLTAAAYTFVQIGENILMPAINALRCAVPCIVPDTELMHEYFDEAALYINPNQADNIAQQLMLLFKDEDKRTTLINNSMTLLNKFDSTSTAQMLWQIIAENGKLLPQKG